MLWVYVAEKGVSYNDLLHIFVDRSGVAMRIKIHHMRHGIEKEMPDAELMAFIREALGVDAPAADAASPAPGEEQTDAEDEVASPVDSADVEMEHGFCAACADEEMSDALLSAVSSVSDDDSGSDATISAPSSPALAPADTANTSMHGINLLLQAAEVQRARDNPATTTGPSSPHTVSEATIQRISAGIEAEKRAAYRAEMRENELQGRSYPPAAPSPAWIQSRMAISRFVVPDTEQEDLDRRREEAERNRRYRYGPVRDE